MQNTQEFFAQNEQRLLEHIRHHAETWGGLDPLLGVSPEHLHTLSAALAGVLAQPDDDVPKPGPVLVNTLIQLTGKTVPLVQIITLLKCYRQAYIEVFNEAEGPPAGMACDMVGRFFDQLEIGICVEMERRIGLERDRANHYLDVVGSIVIALDASGTVTLANKTACEVLGYELYELLGQDWIDTVVPMEQHDEIRDYLYYILSEDLEDEDTHTNYVTTKSGEDRLIAWNNKIIRNDAGMPVGILAAGMDVTDQRAYEDALAEKELWLRNSFVALSDAIIILTPDRQVIDANPSAEAMFQMTNEELCTGSTEKLHVDRAHYVEFGEISARAFERGEKAQFEFVMRRKNGAIFPTENSVSLITGDDGSPLGAVSTIRDISHRKKAETVLRRSEEKFRRIFESIEEGYVVTDLDGMVQMVNPATCKLMDAGESELVGLPINTFFNSEEEVSRFKAILRERGKVRGFHLTIKRPGKAAIVVETNAHMVLDDDGAPVAMEGTFRDITARIEAEKILREREKQYRAFFENNHAIMLLVDPQTEDIMDANPAASEFYGYSLDEMRLMSMPQIVANTETEIFQEMAAAKKEGRSYLLFKHILANKTVRDVEVYSGPIMVRGNQLLYSVIHDVTERVRLEREMKRMATTDALTGASNRHQFFNQAETELKRAQRYGHPLTAIMLDIDYFKSINDTYGHQTGDAVLKALSTLAINTLRETDLFGRLGGEEFAAILPETDLDGAALVAERLRSELSQLKVKSKDHEVQFTVSIGLSQIIDADRIIEDAINRADEALYKAKRMGRNRVERG